MMQGTSDLNPSRSFGQFHTRDRCGRLGQNEDMRPGRILIRLLLISLLVAGCNVFSEAAYQVNLDGSAWSVKSIDGVGSGLPTPSITFDSPARVVTACRTAYLSWDQDTDGSSLVFETPTAVIPPCTGNQIAEDQRLMSALATTESWSVQNNDAIRLRGDHEVMLERLPSTGSVPQP